MPTLRSGAATASATRSAAGTSKSRKRHADSDITEPSAVPFTPPPPLVMEIPSPWVQAMLTKHVHFCIYEKCPKVFHANGLTREVDAPEKTGPSHKFTAFAQEMYDHYIGEEEKSEVKARAKLLLHLEFSKLDPLRQPDGEAFEHSFQKTGLPDWMREIYGREMMYLDSTLERDPELVDMGSLDARNEMISRLRF